jgi:hypothetical protein
MSHPDLAGRPHVRDLGATTLDGSGAQTCKKGTPPGNQECAGQSSKGIKAGRTYPNGRIGIQARASSLTGSNSRPRWV